MLSSSNARLASARRLTRRKDRREAGRFLAEGVQAVREALGEGLVLEVFATREALERHHVLLRGVVVDEISAKDAAALSQTTTPQGLVAVCSMPQVKLGAVFAGEPRLLVVAVEPNDPGNLGTIIRTADAVGADGVIVDGGVDPYNGKVVRASAGSLFHLPIVAARTVDALARAGSARMHTFAADGSGTTDLDDLSEDVLSAPTVWVFGTEAHGLPGDVVAACERSVRIPISGRAESLNVAVAAGVCLYASRRAQRARKPIEAAP